MSTRLVALGVTLVILGTASLGAQDSVPPNPAATDTVGQAVAPVEAPKKKKKGLFGKMKDVAKNKTVLQVAKVAACTVVPGGQVVAGAIDAASNASDGNAGGAAAGIAGAAGGSSCYGGMGGGAPTGGVGGLGGVAGMAAGTAAVVGATAAESRFGGATPGAVPGPDDGSEFVLTEKQEKELIKQYRKGGMSEEQARQQVAMYKNSMATPGAVTINPEQEKAYRDMMKKQGMSDQQIDAALATMRGGQAPIAP